MAMKSTGNDARDLKMCRMNGGGVVKMKKGSKSRVNEAGNYTKAGGKGGAPGQWSARKAQMMAKAYKKAGGGYRN